MLFAIQAHILYARIQFLLTAAFSVLKKRRKDHSQDSPRPNETSNQQLITTLKIKIKAAFMSAVIALVLVFTSPQQSEAATAIYSNYWNKYQYYLSVYRATGNPAYYYGYALPYRYYYYAGYYGDYYGYYRDRNGYKSTYYAGVSQAGYYYDYYAYKGDYYWRNY
jgi:hypothetical protein